MTRLTNKHTARSSVAKRRKQLKSAVNTVGVAFGLGVMVLLLSTRTAEPRPS